MYRGTGGVHVPGAAQVHLLVARDMTRRPICAWPVAHSDPVDDQSAFGCSVFCVCPACALRVFCVCSTCALRAEVHVEHCAV